MSGAGTSLVRFKTTLCDRLAARPGLAGVSVLYAVPTAEMPPVALWLGRAETESLEIPNLRRARLQLQETYDLTCVVQVLQGQGRGEREADQRAVEILAELQLELAEAPRVVDDIQWATLVSWEHTTGRAGTQTGARFDIVVRVHARME